MSLRYALPVFLWTGALPVCAAVDQPDCGVLASWADTFTPPEVRTGPESIPEVFRVDGFAEMFGKPLNAWNTQDFRALDDYMKDCQRQLFKPQAKVPMLSDKPLTPGFPEYWGPQQLTPAFVRVADSRPASGRHAGARNSAREDRFLHYESAAIGQDPCHP